MILGGLLTLFITVLVFLGSFANEEFTMPAEKYQVYLDGTKIGILEDETELYNIINREQSEIKDKYHIEQVYPPKGFEIIAMQTYTPETTKANDIYDKIKEEKEFTIKGYTITIKSKEEGKAPMYINVLDREVFIQALNNLVSAFVDTDTYRSYIEGETVHIVDTGELIEDIRFDETITIKESYIGANEKIYTDVEELSQSLLFGENFQKKEYTVKKGDSIASISEKNKLNPQEFLIANPKFPNEDALLAIGEVVNIALISPQLTLRVDMRIIEDTEIAYERETVYDAAKSPSYRVITRRGIKGVARITKKSTFVNGEELQGVEVLNKQVLREPTKEIITRGRRVGGVYVDTGLDWGWVTNTPYVITSFFDWRWGKMHYGLDITGTGWGSPIYAAADGVVIRANSSCPSNGRGYGDTCGGGLGNNVIIDHQNGYFTTYGHMINRLNVREGQVVKRGDVVGYMGNSGSSTGCHLHYSASTSKLTGFFDPMKLYK